MVVAAPMVDDIVSCVPGLAPSVEFLQASLAPREVGTDITDALQARELRHGASKSLAQTVELGFRPRCVASNIRSLLCLSQSSFPLDVVSSNLMGVNNKHQHFPAFEFQCADGQAAAEGLPSQQTVEVVFFLFRDYAKLVPT